MTKNSTIDNQQHKSLSMTQDGYWEWQIKTGILYFNDIWEGMLGYKQGELIKEFATLETLLHPDDRRHMQRELMQLRQSQRVKVKAQIRMLCKDGSYKSILSRAEVIQKDHEGNPACIAGTHIDMDDVALNQDTKEHPLIPSEREKLESLLKEQNSLLSLFDKGDSILFKWNNDMHWSIEYVSHNVQGLTSYNREDFLTHKLLYSMIIHPDDLARVMQEVSKAVDGNVDFFTREPYRIITKLGEVRWVLDHTVTQKDSDGNITHFIGYISDFTEQISLQQELQESEHRWKLAIEGSGEGVWDWNMLDQTLYLSSKWKAIIGYENHELRHHIDEWKSRIHPDDLTQISIDLQAHIDGHKKLYKNEHRLKCKDGSYRWVLAKGLITNRDSTGTPLRMIGTHSDIDQSKKNQEAIIKAEMKFHTLFEESLDGITLLDIKSQKFIEFNCKAYQMYGYTQEEFANITPKDLEIIETPEEIIQRQHRILTRGWDQFTTQHHTKSGEIKHISVNVKTIAFDERPLLYVSFHDISDEVMLRQTLIEHKERAEKANVAKSEFLANMSHEIRTPLNGIIGLTDFVLNSDITTTQHDYLSKVQHSSHALLRILNDILDYSKIEAGKLDILANEFKLDQLLQNISNLFGFKIHEKGLEFNFSIDPNIPNHLIGDLLRLTQVLNNLVGNAIKFTTSGSIDITVRKTKIDKKSVALAFIIKDSGIGITKMDQKKLFKPFEQVDSSTTKEFGGTGLGLMISKKLINMMGGEIWLESKQGEGSTFGFELTLPYVKKPTFTPTLLHNKKILIIDNHLNNREYLQSTLHALQAQTTVVLNEDEALTLLNTQVFDFIMLDSVDLIAKLNKAKIASSNIILMLTSYNKVDALEQIKEKGVALYSILEKPFTLSSLYHALDTNLKQGNSSTQLKLKKAKKALLVEDHETNQLVASLLLKEYGFKITFATNGKEALLLAKSNTFDIIFMDLQMPIMDGFQAVKEIRIFDRETPIVALSAAVMQRDRERTQQAGMQKHLAKPIIKEELEEVIKEYFEIQNTPRVPLTQNSSQPKITIDGESIYKLKQTLLIKDQQRLYKVYETFYNSYSQITSIHSDTMDAFVHKLKGASGTLNLQSLHKLTLKIEQKGTTPKRVKRLIKRLTHLCHEIKSKILPHIEASNIEPIAKSELSTLMENIIQALQTTQHVPHLEIKRLTQALQNHSRQHIIDQINTLFETKDTQALTSLLIQITKELKL